MKSVAGKGAIVFEPFITMGKYDAHKGMMNPMDSLSIEVSMETLKAIQAKYGGYKYRVTNNPDWTGVRVYPEGTNGFNQRPDGKAQLRITDANNNWVKNIPAFTNSRCEVEFYDKCFDIFVPELRKPPIQKNRVGDKESGPMMELVGETGAVVVGTPVLSPIVGTPTGGTVDQFPAPMKLLATPYPVKKFELFECIDRINEAKRQFGESMLLTVNKDGFLKVMVEHGTD